MKYVVFTMDCISSKKIDKVTADIESRMEKLNKDLLRNKDIILGFKVLVGDEIQGLLAFNENLIANIRYVREAFYPIEVRIGIGIGEIDDESRLALGDPWKLNGQAFHFARKSLEDLSKHPLFYKTPQSRITSVDETFDRLMNNQLMLYDTILSRWSHKTYEAIYLMEKYGSFRKLDGYNHISSSAYTKRASAGHWSVLQIFEQETQEIIKAYIAREAKRLKTINKG